MLGNIGPKSSPSPMVNPRAAPRYRCPNGPSWFIFALLPSWLLYPLSRKMVQYAEDRGEGPFWKINNGS